MSILTEKAHLTLAEFIKDYVTERGMWPEEAEIILELAKKDPVNSSLDGRWNDTVGSYPSSIPAILMMSTNRLALEWIDANKPQAFYRPMFTGELD